MAGFVGPEIPGITDGLVVYYDAALTYTSGDTTWYDAIGNNNATLNNGPTFSTDGRGNIVFDGSDDYATAGYQMPAQSSTTTFTWNLWIYLPSGNGINDVIFGNRYGPANLQFIKITPTNWEYYSGGGNNIGYAIPTDQWVNICVVKDQGTHYYYSNNSQVGTRSSSTSIVSNPVFMGADAYSGVKEACNVKFALASIYNRALSSTEITQNYNALKSRFNL